MAALGQRWGHGRPGPEVGPWPPRPRGGVASEAVAQLDDVLAPGYLTGLTDWSIDRVRSRRNDATTVETGLSYLRRITQGRLDIVLSEEHRRQHGESGGHLDELVGQLPEILGDRVHVPGLGRLPAQMAPGELDPDLSARLEAVLPSGKLDALQDFNTEDLAAVSNALNDFERAVSAQRHAVFDVIDRLQEELVRRYRTGEATVDSLLP